MITTSYIKRSLNHLLTHSSMRFGLNLNRPTFVCAKMTMRCNSRCAHCNIWDMPQEEPELSTAEWLRVLGELRTWLGPFRMVFTGGEALLREDMPLILAHAVGLGIRVELLSNGIMIDDALAAQIVATKIEQITISYDGMSPETHDRFRGGPGLHAATTSAILALVRERNQQRIPLRILLKTVISANNLSELEAIARWAGELGLEVQFQPIEQNYGEPVVADWYKNSSLWISDLVRLRVVLNALQKFKTLNGVISNPLSDFTMFYRYFEQPELMMATIQSHDSKIRNQHCPAAVGNFVLSSNGEVRMCFMMDAIGNVATERPEVLWQNRKRCWAKACAHR